MTTIFLYPAIVVAVTAGLNFIAIYYETISVIPVGVVLKMIAIWFFVALPLAIAGAPSRYCFACVSTNQQTTLRQEPYLGATGWANTSPRAG